MANWFECKIKYDTTDEYGKTKSVTEAYLIDAVSFTDAEQRLYKILDSANMVNFVVSGIRISRVDEIIPSEGDDIKWFKSRIIYYSIDEKSGKEQKIGNTFYVAGTDIFNALENIKTSLSTMLVDWSIDSIAVTKILDVYPYVPENEADNNQTTDEDSQL